MEDKQRNRTSIDGFYSPKPRPAAQRTPVYLDTLRRPETTPPKKQPVAAIQTPKPSESPLLNRTLPNGNYHNLKPKRSESKPKRSFWVKRHKVATSVLSLLLLTLIGGTWYGSQLVANLDKVFHGNVFSDISAAFNDTPLKGEAQGRVNILVAGDSADDPGHGGADLTDSIMVLSINTRNHTAFMLSIPRDLWVNIPGLGNQKINAANDATNFSAPGYPSGGMGQLQQIVQTDLGIPIDYYALVNYQAFEDAVNAVGGITVNIQSPDPRGLYDAYTHLKLPNGEDFLNGATALNLARARGDGSAGDISYGFPDTDFDRTEHQRQMVVAIVQKASTAGVWTNPVRVSGLFSALGKNVQTDLTLQNALRLAELTKGLNLNTIGSYTYSSSMTGGIAPLLETYTDPESGQESLAPTAGVGDFSQLQNYYQQLTSDNPLVKEDASVVVLNGSDVIGLAKDQEAVLKSKGISNISIADANNEYPGTMIINESNGSDPATLKQLQQLFPGTTTTSSTTPTEATEAQGYTANFVVVLGKNWDSYTQP